MSLTAAATGGDSAPVAGERCGTAFSLDLNVGVFFFFFFALAQRCMHNWVQRRLLFVTIVTS